MKMYESMGNGGFHTKKIHREVWLMRKKKFIDQIIFIFFDYSAFFKYSQTELLHFVCAVYGKLG